MPENENVIKAKSVRLTRLDATGQPVGDPTVVGDLTPYSAEVTFKTPRPEILEALTGGALVAQGGWCAPSQTVYDVGDHDMEAVIDLNEVAINIPETYAGVFRENVDLGVLHIPNDIKFDADALRFNYAEMVAPYIVPGYREEVRNGAGDIVFSYAEPDRYEGPEYTVTANGIWWGQREVDPAEQNRRQAAKDLSKKALANFQVGMDL